MVNRSLINGFVLLGLLGAATVAIGQEYTAQEWIGRMSMAVHSTNYEGTVVRLQNGNAEALKVVHLVQDGVVHEKVVTQEGNGLEIIRKGNEVHCILPDKKSVLVEEWDDQGTLFTALPSNDISFGSEYDLSIVREERVAGRKTVLVAIRPHDEYRFGHRLWLDSATGFPLQTQLLDESGEAVEQVKFADIRIDEDIQASALAPSTSTADFRWFTQPPRTISHEVESPWGSEEVPPGFRPVSMHQEEIEGREATVVHVLYSDGLANVSVFIEPAGDIKMPRRSRVGTSNSFSTRHEGFQVTAVGEVPAATVEKIATSMRPQ